MKAKPNDTSGAVVRLRRILRARREKVFEAWTDPRQLEKWFAPSDEFKVHIRRQDLKAGGAYRFEMDKGRGETFRLEGAYRLIQPPDKLVFTWRWHDWEGSQPDSVVTLEFLERGESTELILTHEMLPDAPSRERHSQGWNGCLGRLERLVEAQV